MSRHPTAVAARISGILQAIPATSPLASTLLTVLAACASHDDTAVADCLSYPASTPLGSWAAPASTGRSLDDALGFAIGSWSGSFWWDDGSSTAFSLDVEAGGAEESSWGDPAVGCEVTVYGDVAWTLTTEDARVAAAEETRWAADDRPDRKKAIQVGLGMDLAPNSFGLPPLDAASTLNLSIGLRSDGTISVTVAEDWMLDEDTLSDCVRATNEAADLGCHYWAI